MPQVVDDHVIVANALSVYLERNPNVMTKQPACPSDWMDFGLMVLAIARTLGPVSVDPQIVYLPIGDNAIPAVYTENNDLVKYPFTVIAGG